MERNKARKLTDDVGQSFFQFGLIFQWSRGPVPRCCVFLNLSVSKDWHDHAEKAQKGDALCGHCATLRRYSMHLPLAVLPFQRGLPQPIVSNLGNGSVHGNGCTHFPPWVSTGKGCTAQHSTAYTVLSPYPERWFGEMFRARLTSLFGVGPVPFSSCCMHADAGD